MYNTMLRYKRRNPKPLVKQTEFFFGRNYNSLYELDRRYAINYEQLKGRDLVLYDRDIELQKKKEEQTKGWLMAEAEELLSASPQPKKSFKLSFNKFNGYRIEYNGEVYETFNHLFNDYIHKVFHKDLIQK